MTSTSSDSKPQWQILAANKHKQCEDSIPIEWRLPEHLQLGSLDDNLHLLAADIPRRSGLLSEDELAITEKYSAAQLAQKLAVAEFSSVTVTKAFCKRAAIAQQLVC